MEHLWDQVEIHPRVLKKFLDLFSVSSFGDISLQVAPDGVFVVEHIIFSPMDLYDEESHLKFLVKRFVDVCKRLFTILRG